MRLFLFYYLCYLLLSQYENFVNGMIKSASSLTSSNYENTNEEKGKAKIKENISPTNLERNGKKILFIVRNIHFSNYQIFVNLANKLNDSGYIVHLIIANAYDNYRWRLRENELNLPKLNPNILCISIRSYFMLIFGQNQMIEIMGEKHPFADWLHGQNYALGMADIEFLKEALDVFDKLQIRGSIIVSASPLKSIILHLLGMSLPYTIPEFSRAIPGDGNGNSGIRKPFSPRQDENIEEYKFQIRKDASSASSVDPNKFAKLVRYVLVNQHPLVQFHQLNRSPSPFLKFIGGIHIEEFALKMKENDNRKLLYPESDCLVLFSLGTIKSLIEENSFMKPILKAFAGQSHQCQFIVSNFDEQHLTEGNKKILQRHKNIKIFKEFVQQKEILAQTNLRLFISHCGQNSLNEAVYFGVPIICIPFFFDQFHNAAIVEFLGNGKFLKYQNVKKTFRRTLNKMLKIEKNSYRRIAQKLKEMIMASPDRSGEFISVVDKAILELEQNEMPNLTVKSATEGWTFDSPILDDNFVKVAEEDLS